MKQHIVKAIVLAGGYSTRLKGRLPKQLLKIGDKPLLAYTLDIFEQCPAVAKIILVSNPKYLKQCCSLVRKYRYKKIEQLLRGGHTRQQSVWNALNKIGTCSYVVIHDGVRPLLSRRMLLETIKAVRRFQAVTCAVKATDSIVDAKSAFVRSFLPRRRIWQIQTPQAFKFALLLRAHQKARRAGIFSATDDAQLLLRLKQRVKIIEGSYQNLKITTAADLKLAKLLVS